MVRARGGREDSKSRVRADDAAAAEQGIYTQIFTHMSQVHWGHVGTRPDSVRVFTHWTTQSRWKT